MKIGVDIGHNVNYDTGARGIGYEDELNSLVGHELIAKLKGTNAIIINCTPQNATSLTDSLRKRVATANKEKCDVFISIHHNAGGGYGAEVLMYPGDKVGALGNEILTNFQKIGLRNRGLKNRNDLFVLSQTQMPALIIECAFVDSESDMRSYNYKNVANSIFNALCSYYGLKSNSIVNERKYTVVKGDTLWGISRKFNTTVDNLKVKNNIENSNLIYPGQVLII